MVKHLLNFLLIFLVLSSFVFAKNMGAQLQAEYGADLTHAPFFLRFSFSKEYNIDWKDSNYQQREIFLTKYETDLAAEQKQDRAEAKAEAENARELSNEKREAQREERAKLKAQMAEEKAEQQDYEQRQKAMDDVVKQQEKELQQMQREATQSF